ncbi:MAG: hypothetical protein ABW073_07925 [Acidimicrobiia bacterium]
MAWNVAIAVIVIVGIVAVMLTRSGGASDGGEGGPRAVNQTAGVAGDHWHTYLGVNICGEWLGGAPEFEKPYSSPNQASNAGVHSHGDGLVHTHPFVPSEQGTNATLGKFLSYGGWTINDSTIDLGGSNAAHTQWQGPLSKPKQTVWKNGDTCTFGEYKGQKGEIVWAVDGKKMTGNPSDYHQQDGETIAVGFLPKGTELGFPPDACTAFAQITDANAAPVSKKSPCLAAASTTTTVPSSDATTTTAPAP